MDYIGNKTVSTAECSRSHKPVLSERLKRKLKSIFTPTSLQAEQTEEPSEMQRQRGKRGRKPMKSDKPAVDTAPVPTKGLFVLFVYDELSVKYLRINTS